MNKVVLIGRLTRDPELKFTPGNSTAVCSFTLAVDRKFSKDGKKEADFINIVVWGKIAESSSKYLSKGGQVGIAGRIQTRSYDAKDGTKRYVTEVIAEEVKFLSKKDNSQSQNNNFGGQEDYGNENFNNSYTPVDDGDIPF